MAADIRDGIKSKEQERKAEHMKKREKYQKACCLNIKSLCF